MMLSHAVAAAARRRALPLPPLGTGRSNSAALLRIVSASLGPVRFASSGGGNRDDPAAKREAFTASLASTRAAQKAGNASASAVARAPSDMPSSVVVGVSERATAGLSQEYLDEWAAKAQIGADKPVVWDNPGAYAQIARVPNEVLAALPPPRRPFWPMAAGELTWKYLRSYLLSLVFVGLAGYLHVKSRLSNGAARVELERDHPMVAAALVKAGLLADYSHLLEEEEGGTRVETPSSAAIEASSKRGFDRPLLFSRLYRRFTLPDTLGGNVTASVSAISAAPAVSNSGSAAAASSSASDSNSNRSWFGWITGSGGASGSSASVAASASSDDAHAILATPSSIASSSAVSRLMPLSRAIVLLAVLRGEVDGAALAPPAVSKKADNSSNKAVAPAPTLPTTSKGPGADALLKAVKPSHQLKAAVAALPPAVLARGALTEAEFAALASASTKGVSPIVLYLTSSESLGVTSASTATLEALRGLFDDIITHRSSGPAFTPSALSELVSDIGLTVDEPTAADALADSAAVACGRYPMFQTVTEGPQVGRLRPLPVPLSREEFSDFAAAAAASAGVSEARLPDYIRVFRLLHLSDMRRSAGVAGL